MSENHRIGQLKRFKDPNERKKLSKNMLKSYNENPERIEVQRQNQINLYKDNNEREKQSKSQIKSFKDNPDRKQKSIKRLKGKYKETSLAWKGGGLTYLHLQARELFDTPLYCYLCGVTEEEYSKRSKKGISLHCFHKRYDLMHKMFWTPVCRKCHMQIEKLN